MNKKTLVFGLIIFLLTIQYAFATQDIFYRKVENAKLAGALITGLADVNISFYDAATSGASFYNETIADVNFTSGEAFLTLDGDKTNLDFSSQYWIEMKVNTTTFDRQKVGSYGFCLLSNSSILDADTIAFTGVNSTVILNSSGTLQINQTTFDAKYLDDTDTDTTYNSDEIYIYESSDVFYLNETAMNATIGVLDTDTNTFNSSGEKIAAVNATIGTLTMNISCNNIVDGSDADFCADADTGAASGNSSGEMIFAVNNTIGTLTMNVSCNSIVDGSGDDLCTVADTDTDTIAFTGVNNSVVTNVSGVLNINQSFFDGLYLDDTDTTYDSDEIYIYESSDVFYLNETALNATVEALDTDTDTNTYNSSGEMVETINKTVGTFTMNLSCSNVVDETGDDLCTVADTDTDTIAFTGTNLSVILNNSGSLGINQTTFDSLYLDDTDTTYDSDETYIYESSDVFYLNETALNATIGVLDTDTYNSSTDMVETINKTGGTYMINVSISTDLVCTDCITGTEIAELTDADVSNTLTCSVLTDDDTYALTASAETFDENVVFAKNITIENIHGESDASHYITNNATCWIFKADTATLNIC